MKLRFHAPALGAPQHSQALCALLAPKPTVYFQPRLKVLLLLLLLLHPNYIPISVAVALSHSTSSSQSLSDNPITIESA
jgi:hypothetical protein